MAAGSHFVHFVWYALKQTVLYESISYLANWYIDFRRWSSLKTVMIKFKMAARWPFCSFSLDMLSNPQFFLNQFCTWHMGTLTIGADWVWKTAVSPYKMAAWQSFWIEKKYLKKKIRQKFWKKFGILIFMHVKLFTFNKCKHCWDPMLLWYR